MPPIAKENEVPGTTPENSGTRTSATNTRPDETASRPQPVALEVSVTVNGARTIEGSDKREPFSEATKTVLIFGSGAVIRLSSLVTPGQLLFLTNEKTKKEVVCQVVKSKNYRNVSGYVELEFTEPVVGFWGMRFPGDHVVAPSPAAATGSPTVPPSPPKVISSAVSAAPKTQDVKPAPIPLPAKPVETKATEVLASTPAAKAMPPAPTTGTPTAPTQPSEPKPAAPPVIKQEPTSGAGQGSTEALKLQAARLQEQLSSMLFTGNQPAAQAPKAPTTAPNKASSPEASGKVLEMAKPEPTPAQPMPPRKVTPPPIKSSLDTEEIKIPAWLEPLARNTVAPASTQDLIEREKAKLAAKTEPEEQKAEAETKTETGAEPVIAAPEMVPPSEPQAEQLGLYSFEKEFSGEENASGGSRKGLWIGVAAAGMIAVAAGGWYFYKQKLIQQTAAAATTPAPNMQPTQPVAQSVIPTTASPAQNATTNAASSNKPDANAMVSNAQPPAATAPGNPGSGEKVNPKAGQNARETTRDTVKESARTVPAAENEVVLRTVEPAQKKPGFGKVRLATPKVNRATAQQENGVSEPTLSTSDAGISPEALGSGLAISNAKQPAAPESVLPVGGDVKPAKLASSVSPIYPALARSQHVSGDVKIDALIDANGKVTSMKVIAGPTLLHQSATDALRQWKYQPATLDGKPVPMHLTVTLQFRLQ
jgi:TonB family protein